MQLGLDVAQQRGASTIFSVRPLERHGFVFDSKRDFRDLIRMRYRRVIPNLPSTCACGKEFSLDHSQICKIGGFVLMRHDGPKNSFAYHAKQVFNDVEIEPELQPLEGEPLEMKSANRQDDARSDVRVKSFWSRQRNAFFEFRVFYPFAASWRKKCKTLSRMYSIIESARKAEYEQRIREVESSDFTPMIFSSCGGMGPQATIALKRLAENLAEKRKEPYSLVVAMLRCKLSFEIARAALVCLRGSRSLSKRRETTHSGDAPEVILAEAGLSHGHT